MTHDYWQARCEEAEAWEKELELRADMLELEVARLKVRLEAHAQEIARMRKELRETPP